jgi:hypothetical protein
MYVYLIICKPLVFPIKILVHFFNNPTEYVADISNYFYYMYISGLFLI